MFLYSTPGRRRTWGPASQPGSLIIFSIPADFRSYSRSWKQNNAQVLYPEYGVELRLSKFVLIFNFPARNVLKKSRNSSLAVLRRHVLRRPGVLWWQYGNVDPRVRQLARQAHSTVQLVSSLKVCYLQTSSKVTSGMSNHYFQVPVTLTRIQACRGRCACKKEHQLHIADSNYKQ